MTIQPDMFNLSARDVILPIVPLYHANAWGLTFSAPCVGAKLVLPGARLDGASLCELIASEGVTFAAGVPTVWLALIDHLRQSGRTIPTLRRAIVGGAALPQTVLDAFDAMGIEAVHAWGMTEMSPVGGVNTPSAETAALSGGERHLNRLKQGRVPYGIDMRIVDERQVPVPHDGKGMGALQVRGPAVARRYFRQDENLLDVDGFFDTGDIATIDPCGYVQITDRAKDIVKSGGEWISSIELENAAITHAKVDLAAVVGVPHPKWDERPLLFITLKQGEQADAAEIVGHLTDTVPKWWLPDEVRFLDAMPLGPTGKIDKKALRAICHEREEQDR